MEVLILRGRLFQTLGAVYAKTFIYQSSQSINQQISQSIKQFAYIADLLLHCFKVIQEMMISTNTYSKKSVYFAKGVLYFNSMRLRGCSAGCVLVLLHVVNVISAFTKCYPVNNQEYCFYTDGSVLSWDDAREFCRSRNSTLPIITDEDIDNAFQQFLDSNNVSSIFRSVRTERILFLNRTCLF